MNSHPTRFSGVYAITPCGPLDFDQILAISERLLSVGLCALQYRDKEARGPRLLRQATQLAQICRAHHTPFIVNDYPRVALECGADGAHLGADDPALAEARGILGPGSIIGVSCYDDLSSALIAQQAGADYVAFGAFFPTTTKVPRTRATPALLEQAHTRLTCPVVAIGGITPENCAPLLAAGANALAVSGSLYLAADPVGVLRQLQFGFGQQEGEAR